MTTDDDRREPADLRERLERLAASGGPAPQPDAVLAGARAASSVGGPAAPRPVADRPRPRGRILSVGAVVLLVGGLVTWRIWPDAATPSTPTTQVTAHGPGRSAAPVAITVPAVGVAAVTEAFGKVWVASVAPGTPPTTTVRAYDAGTGRPAGTVHDRTGSTTLAGRALVFAVTDHALWLRTDLEQPEIDNTSQAIIYRIEPDTLHAGANRHLQGDGAGPTLVGYRDRIVATDATHLEIIREDGIELAVPSTADSIGPPPASSIRPVGTPAIGPLLLDADGLWAITPEGGVAPLDATTGVVGTVHPTPTGVIPVASPDQERVWWWGPTDPGGGGRLLGAVLDSPDRARVGAPAAVAFPAEDRYLGQVDDQHVLVADTRTRQASILDTTTGTLADPPGPRWADGWNVLRIDGSPTIISWVAHGGTTTVTRTPVPTALPPAGTPPATPPVGTGIIDGILQEVGGPAPGSPRRIGGEVSVSRKTGQPFAPPVIYRVGLSGRFRIPAVPGTYRVTARPGTSGPLFCTAPALVVVGADAAHDSPIVTVTCSVR